MNKNENNNGTKNEGNNTVSGYDGTSELPIIVLAQKDPSPNNEIAYQVMESLMIISIAGFGGALCGLAISRRGGGGLSPLFASRVSAGSLKSSSTLRKSARAPYYIDHELPTAWAVACITFASIMEFSRMISPATKLMDLLYSRKNNIDAVGRTFMHATAGQSPSTATPTDQGELTNIQPSSVVGQQDSTASVRATIDTDLCLVFDYLLGGAVAGAAFKGTVIRSQASLKGLALRGGPVLPASMTAARTGILTGMIPGAALGFLAGLAVYGTVKLQKYAEQVLNTSSTNGARDSDLTIETEQRQQIEPDDGSRSKGK